MRDAAVPATQLASTLTCWRGAVCAGTERGYVRVLTELTQLYKAQFSKPGSGVAAADVGTIFNNVELLFALHTRLCAALETALQSSRE